MLSIKEKISKNYINAIGWSTKQKYLLIESDDWGAVRMPSRKVYDKLIKNNIPVDKFSFDKNDSVESEDDLNELFSSLEKFRDKIGNPAVLTAYHVLANPYFEKINASNRKEYHYETILETYASSGHTKNVPELIKEGMRKGVYIPQFHGREHIHVKRWMEAINSTSQKEQIAFENEAIISTKSKSCTSPYLKNYFASLDYDSIDEFSELEKIHSEGLELFEQIFGFKSLTFMAQGSVYGDHILKNLNNKGVKLVNGQQLHPNLKGGFDNINKYWGANNKYGQKYWRRNCMFEPGRNQDFDWVGKCMEEIEIAFRWGKPAVISSHRENFIGSIFKENRKQSLKKLERLLEKVILKWPDVQFINSAQLAEIMFKLK